MLSLLSVTLAIASASHYSPAMHRSLIRVVDSNLKDRVMYINVEELL
jgi:hypothetical protein